MLDGATFDLAVDRAMAAPSLKLAPSGAVEICAPIW